MLPINREYVEVARGEGILVNSYTDLLERISELAYDYPKNVLYYRGQEKDYLTSGKRSTLYPSIYRGTLREYEIKERFRILDEASRALIEVSKKYNLKGVSEMRKKKQILWSILQHYEICHTPLLDITHSLRTACTFAFKKGEEFGYIYVLAMPYLTNRITYNSEEDILLIRLLSISPPAAKRPFYQEGYVAGTPDVADNYDDKNELDLVNRLVAKYKIKNTQAFWCSNFSSLSKDFIYPEDDTFNRIKEEVVELRNRGFYTDSIGDFLLLWNNLEDEINREMQSNAYRSLLAAVSDYSKSYELDRKVQIDFEKVRKFRNLLVHNTREISEKDIKRNIDMLISVRNNIYSKK